MLKMFFKNNTVDVVHKSSKVIFHHFLKQVDGNVSVDSIEVNPKNIILKKNQTIQLTANILPSNATDKSVTWVSSNEAFCTVTSSGLVTCLIEGECEIWCYSNDGNKRATCLIQKEDEELETFDEMNKVPYISTYFIKATTDIENPLIIDYYITDFYNKENLENLYTETFTVVVEVDDIPIVIEENLLGGNHSIQIPPQPEGGHHISLQVIDKKGRKSHKLYNEVRWLNKTSDLNDINNNTYVMTNEDLTTYNIVSNSIDNAVNNRIGINNIIQNKKASGCRKLVLLEGFYVIDEGAPIQIPSYFTLDLNNSVIKRRFAYSELNNMISFTDVHDAHLINGTIRGQHFDMDDVVMHEEERFTFEQECAIFIMGDSKYCTVENVNIEQIKGYAVRNGVNDARYGGNDDKCFSRIGFPNYTYSNVDIVAGVEVNCDYRSTTGFTDITPMVASGFMSVNIYLNYQGIVSNSAIISIHFYDQDKNFIKTEISHQYRKTKIPNGAKFVRITFYDASYKGEGYQFTNFKVPVNCEFKNMNFVDNRTCGFSPQAMNNILIDNCDFVRTGVSTPTAITPLAIDLEDGWQMQQDCTISNCTFDNTAQGEIVVCAGFNIIVDNTINSSINMRNGVYGYCIKNVKAANKLINNYSSSNPLYSKNRFFNISLDGGKIGSTYSSSSNKFKQTFYNLETIDGGIIGNSNFTIDIHDSIFKNTALEYVNAYNSEFVNYTTSGFTNSNCSFGELKDSTSLKLTGSNKIENITIGNMEIILNKNNSKDIEFAKCDFNNTKLYSYHYFGLNKLFINDCKINNSDKTFINTSLYNLKDVLLQNSVFNCSNRPILDVYNTNYNNNVFNGFITVSNNTVNTTANNVIGISGLTYIASGSTITIYNNNNVITNSNAIAPIHSAVSVVNT